MRIILNYVENLLMAKIEKRKKSLFKRCWWKIENNNIKKEENQ